MILTRVTTIGNSFFCDALAIAYIEQIVML